MLAPVLDRLADKNMQVDFVKVDIDKHPDLAEMHQVFIDYL